MNRKLVSLLASTTALAACGQDNAAPPAAQPTASASPSAAAAPAPTPSATAAAREITLTSTGLILVNAVEGRGAATTLTFDTPQTRVLAALGEDFPAPTNAENLECGAGAMRFATYGALTLNFLDGKLVGWLAERGDNLVTSDGIRPGIPLADLRAERPVEMVDSTLEGEFAYQSPDGGSIGGFVDPQGRIVSLNAGVQCFFR